MTTEVNLLIENIKAELQSQADPSYRELVRTRYNMNVDNFWGVRTPVISSCARDPWPSIPFLMATLTWWSRP